MAKFDDGPYVEINGKRRRPESRPVVFCIDDKRRTVTAFHVAFSLFTNNYPSAFDGRAAKPMIYAEPDWDCTILLDLSAFHAVGRTRLYDVTSIEVDYPDGQRGGACYFNSLEGDGHSFVRVVVRGIGPLVHRLPPRGDQIQISIVKDA